MSRKSIWSFLFGFIFLFSIYHFPEFFSAFWIMATFKIGFLVAAFLLALVQGWKRINGYGLNLKSGWAHNLIKGLCIGLIGFGLSVLASVLLGYEKVILYPTFEVIIRQAPMILLMTAIPSIAEDILTRGYLLGHLAIKMEKGSWILTSAIVFVLNHVWRLNDGTAVLSYLFFLGILLAYTVWKTNSLWLAFGLHWGSNIAFESTNSILKMESQVSHKGSTWILAIIWIATLLVLIISDRNKTSKQVVK